MLRREVESYKANHSSDRLHPDPKVVKPAKLDGLLAGTRADGGFLKLPEDCQLVEAAFCVASKDNDRDMISAEDAGEAPQTLETG